MVHEVRPICYWHVELRAALFAAAGVVRETVAGGGRGRRRHARIYVGVLGILGGRPPGFAPTMPPPWVSEQGKKAVDEWVAGCKENQKGYKVKDDPEAGYRVLVHTPALTSDEVASAMAEATAVAQEENMSSTLRSRVEVLFPEEARRHAGLGTTSEELQESAQVEGVQFANGDSDAESIRDYDSGPGLQRWHRREAYFYRREENLEGQTYRRRMKLRSCPFPFRMPKSEKELWEAECQSDEDGQVCQKTFIQKAEIEIDDVTGEVVGLTSTEPEPDKDGMSMIPAWRRTKQAIENKIVEPPTSAEPDPVLRAAWFAKIPMYAYSAATQEYRFGLEELWKVISLGHDPLTGGLSRELECVECTKPMLTGKAGSSRARTVTLEVGTGFCETATNLPSTLTHGATSSSGAPSTML